MHMPSEHQWEATSASSPPAQGYTGGEEAEDEGEDSGETAEQYMMRRIKDWNVAVRKRPHELQLWLDFAAFQDNISK